MSDSLHVSVEADAHVQLATANLKRQFVHAIRFENRGENDLENLKIDVAFDPALVHPKTLHIAKIPAGHAVAIPPDQLKFSLQVDRLANLTERQSGNIAVSVSMAGSAPVTAQKDIAFEAPNEWLGLKLPPEALAAFVTPNHPEMGRVLAEVRADLRERGLDDSLEGYQKRSPGRVLELASAAFAALKRLGIGYANPPASFHKTGQKIRGLEQVLGDKLGTCLDLTVFTAGVLEQMGLHPLVILVEGHAVVGVWLTDWHLPSPWSEDPAPIRKRVKLDECCVFDPAGAPAQQTFTQAIASTAARLEDAARFLFALDIAACRDVGITPMGLHRSAAFSVEGAASVTVRAETLPSVAPKVVVAETPEARIDRWKGKLLDLTLRNRLINHRDSNSVLPLLGQSIGAIEDALNTQQKLELVARTRADRVDDPSAYVNAATKSGRLAVDLPSGDFEKRVLELYRKNGQMLEESGVTALFLALGTLQWFESEASSDPRLAPILLIPITLERVKVGGPYLITRTDDDAIWNASLFQKLEREFGVKAAGFGAAPPADDAGVDVDGALRLVLDAVKNLPRFDVVWDGTIAFYQFQKFMMWMDLEANAQKLMASEVVRHIVEGSEKPFPTPAGLPDPAKMDARPAVEDLSVVDADSSQLAAIFSALDGNSFVLQGPPGTGKSQTITNLIAQALARDKSVLFVSEKRAALEVVESRLKAVGLGPFTLEVHSDKASRSQVVKQLEEPLKFAWSKTATQWEEHAEKISTARDTLNRHVAKFHEPGPFGESLYQVVGHLIALDTARTPKIRVPFAKTPDRKLADQHREWVAQFALRSERVGVPQRHPWRFVRQTDWSTTWHERVIQAAQDAAKAGERWAAARERVVDIIAPNSSLPPQVFDVLGGAADHLGQCPGVPTSLLTENRDVIAAAIDDVAAPLKTWSVSQAAVQERWALSLLDEPTLHQDALRFRRWAPVFFLLAFFALFFTRSRIRAYATADLPSNAVIATDLQTAETARDARKAIQGAEVTMRGYFGAHWKGVDTDVTALRDIWSWARKFREILAAVREQDASVADALVALATDTERLGPQTQTGKALGELREATSGWDAARDVLFDAALLEPDWRKLDGEQQRTLLRQWLDSSAKLQPWCDWLASAEKLRNGGLGIFVDATIAGELDQTSLNPAYERGLREFYWNARSESDPEIRAFRGYAHEQAIARFAELDLRSKNLAREEIQARLAARLPDPLAPGEMEVLRGEFKKKTRHKAIRKLFEEVPNVLMRLKPCVLMSPLSVARFLDPALQMFDIVVFDEASQIPPWDAIGAIARGKQAVIVGDSKQLPPTSFFTSSDSEESFEDEDIVDMESILDQATTRGVPQMTLNWHYRSRHESLISFSNYHYYDNRLHVFPSPMHRAENVGLKWVHVADGVYDRGKSRTNRREAEEVVRELTRRLMDAELSEKSIGVVTFSMAQQRLIEQLMDESRLRHPQLDKFFSEQVPEPVFIKNLENVQGDERDVMLFSIGYGPDASGKTTLSFGPLNRVGGERRLNVAVTRARELMMVYSTLRPDQIDANAANPAVRQLKTFLDYANRGSQALLEVVTPDDTRGFGSPFEREVYEALVAQGWEVHTQVGVGGFFIDLAIVHPKLPGTYLLGIECDGAAYHSAKTARDRDRIRQGILENLGWRIHRIWSTDWWTHRDQEIQRVKAVLQNALDAHLERQLVQSALKHARVASVLPPERSDVPERRWPEGVRAWIPPSDLETYEQDGFYGVAAGAAIDKQLAQLADEAAPLTLEMATRLISRAWNFNNTSKKMQARVAEIASGSRAVFFDGEVIWKSHAQKVSWRGFRHHEKHSREVTEVPLPELREIIVWNARRAVSIDRDGLIAETARVLGYHPGGKKMKEVVGGEIDAAVRGGVLATVDDKIRVL